MKPDLVAPSCNSSSWEVEEEESLQIQDQPGL